MNIAIARPYVGAEEKQAVLAVLESGQLAQGAKVAEFERAFADYHGARHAIATSNGTTALQTALMAHGIGAGDEVIVPAFSFFATASAVLGAGAQPVFADIDRSTYCLAVEAAENAITPRTRAIMPVHLYGHPADMPRFRSLCDARGLILLEDAAQAHGAAIGQKRVGTWGTAAFSFYPTKNMMTAEGGMVLTEDDEVARKARLIRHHGMDSQYHHTILGFNFRMTDIAAAIGLVQLGRLPEWTRRRVENARRFGIGIKTLDLPSADPTVTHVFHQYTVRVRAGMDRDRVVERLNQRGIGARVYYATPIHQQPLFQTMPDRRAAHLPETELAAREVLSLPVHPALKEDEREYIVEEVNRLC